MKQRLAWNSALILLLVAVTSSAQDEATSIPVSDADRPFLLNYPNIENSDGDIVLTNEHVVLQRLVVPAGKWEGGHSHPGNQIYVHIHGGEWSGRMGGELDYSGSISPDGGVGWMDPIPLSAGHDSGNTGDTDIDLIYVTLKTDSPISPDVEHVPQHYPEIPTEVVLENDRLIVQRFQIEPGQWTGVHSHPGNQVYIHIKGGILSQRHGGEQSPPAAFAEAGAVGWQDAIELSEGHESGNTGDTTIDMVLVTIK